MGCYGIGPGRVMAAAVEQRHDATGIVWPPALAPYELQIVALTGGSQDVLDVAAELESLAEAEGLAVLLDDRDSRPGEKFADADLIGAPWRATVGRKSLEDGVFRLLT
jgi:prolyl-tRNA synthetase